MRERAWLPKLPIERPIIDPTCCSLAIGGPAGIAA
jgi:hypothetical protein